MDLAKFRRNCETIHGQSEKYSETIKLGQL